MSDSTRKMSEETVQEGVTPVQVFRLKVIRAAEGAKLEPRYGRPNRNRKAPNDGAEDKTEADVARP